MFDVDQGFSFTDMLDQTDKGVLVRQALYDASGEICDFRIVYANKAMEGFYPFPAESFAGPTPRGNAPEGNSTPLMRALKEISANGQPGDYEYFSFAHGRYVRMLNITPLKGYILSIYEFICETPDQYPQIFPASSRIKQILNNADEVFWIRNGDKILYVNPAFEKIFGLSCARFYKDLYSILDVVDSKDHARLNHVLRNDGIQMETNYNIEFRIKGPNGSTKWLWLKTFSILEITGDIVKKAATLIDITERKLMEEELHHQNREISTLYDLFKRAAEHVDLDELLEKAQQIILENLNAQCAAIFLHDPEKDMLLLKSCLGLSPEMISFAEGHYDKLVFTQMAFREKENMIVAVSDHKEALIRDTLHNEGIRHLALFPVLYDDRALGVLCLAWRQDTAINMIKTNFISTICNQLAVLINNARLYEQLKQELEKRKKAEKENELIFTTSIDLLAIIKPSGRLVRISPQWEKCLGWDEGDLLGANIFKLVHADDREGLKSLGQSFLEEKVLIGHEIRVLCKNGSYRWIAWNARLVADNREKLIIATGRDITLNKEIEDKNRELEKAYQLETVKMEFFANISHEFRTPLNIIISALQLIQHILSDRLEELPAHERLSRHLKSIKQNAYRLLRLVNNLIDITKLDSGYLKLYKNNHDIVSMVENITQSVAQYIEGKGINLIFDTDVEEKVLACDADMIERILLNLLSNAVKYTEKGGIITVTVKDLESAVRISVKDTGVGISEDKLDLIFERFVQGDKPLSRRCEGSGIGLSLVKSLVELHGGRVFANSTLEKGSEFAFEIPADVLDKGVQFQTMEPSIEERIHKINVEFSDIYSLNV